VVAAAVAVPVTDDLETKEEWGSLREWASKTAHSFAAAVKGKACLIRKCPSCAIKYKSSGWGRRRTRYTDCTHRTSCITDNAKCQAKIDSLKATVRALDVEIAAAKEIVAKHKATAAEKARLAEDEKKEEIAALQALKDGEAQKATEAEAVAGEIDAQHKTKKSEADDVKEAHEDHEDAIEEHKKKEAALEEKEAALEAAAKHEAKAAADVKLAAAEKAQQIAEQKAANAKMAQRVKHAEAKLAAAQADRQGFADAHKKEAAEAAQSEQAAASARELVKVKQAVVKLHEDKKKEVQKKMEASMQ
jgi:chromosome segregation ATPase